MKALRRFTVRAHLPDRLAALERLSVNLRWSWDKPTQELFAAIDPDTVEAARSDPVALLGQVTPKRLDELAADDSFLRRLDGLAADLDNYLTRPLWYQEQPEGAPLPTGIAYFSMEFGVSEVLPNYSGGLGILAGDHLKSASDLGLPLIAVGPAVPVGLLPAVADRRRLAARDLPVAGPAGPAAAAADRQDGDRCWWSWRCRTASSCGPGSGSRRSAECRCCCWTPTSRRTSTTCAESPTGSTAATRNTASSRRSWPASAGCGRSARSPKSRGCPRPRCST